MDMEIADNAMRNGILIDEQFVEVCPECVPLKCLDENICINMVKKYFTIDAWALVENVVSVIKERREWDCVTCCSSLSAFKSIVCESCLDWFHLKCVGLKTAPKKKNWFCRSCYK